MTKNRKCDDFNCDREFILFIDFDEKFVLFLSKIMECFYEKKNDFLITGMDSLIAFVHVAEVFQFNNFFSLMFIIKIIPL